MFTSASVRVLSTLSVCALALVYASDGAVAQETTDPAPRHGVTRVGVTVRPIPGHPYREARRKAVNRYGQLPTIRYFDPNAPNAWSRIRYDVGKRPVITSFKMGPADVLAGRYDRILLRWFKSAPVHRPTWWSYHPEPEDDIAAGKFSASRFRAAWARIAHIAQRAHNPRLQATLVLMCYTLSEYSHRDWHDYYGGNKVVDVMGWDCYNEGRRSGQYWTGKRIFGHAIRLSHRLGKPFGVAEVGSVLVGSDNGKRRADWLTAVTSYLTRHEARFVSYFDVRQLHDYRLRDRASKQAMRRMVTRSLKSIG